MSDDVKRSDAEWFESADAKDYKIDHSQVLQLQDGDILIVKMDDDVDEQIFRRVQETIASAIQRISPGLNVLVYVTPASLSFSVLRTKLEKENVLKPQPQAPKPDPGRPSPYKKLFHPGDIK